MADPVHAEGVRKAIDMMAVNFMRDDGKNRVVRERNINILKFFAPHMSNGACSTLFSCDISPRLYAEAAKLGAADFFEYQPSHSGTGRGGFAKVGTGVADAWRRECLDSNDGNFYLREGSKSAVAAKLAAQFELNVKTIYKHCPNDVKVGQRYTDVCIRCESLRAERLAHMRKKNWKNLVDGQAELTASYVKTCYEFCFKNSPPAPSAEMEALLWHERVVVHQKRAHELQVQKASKESPCLIIDYAASIILRDQRSDAVEFFCPRQLGLFLWRFCAFG